MRYSSIDSHFHRRHSFLFKILTKTVRGPSQKILYDKKQCLSIYCVDEE
nr:MAG TPA: hypothetical protein [Caudoviricetes sp.]